MRQRSAFTLVEVLIVVTIVAILAVLAVSSYGVARKKAKIEIVTDTIVSVLRQQKSLAMSGKTGGNLMTAGLAGSTQQNIPTCYGMYFKTDAAPYVQMVEAPYVSVDTKISQDKSDFCDMTRVVPTAFGEMENFRVSDIQAFGNPVTSSKGFAIVFRPPIGRVSLGSLDALQPLGVVTDSTVRVKLESANGDSVTGFVFDASTGLTERSILQTL